MGGTPEGLAAAVADGLGVGGRVAAVGGACAAGNFALARALDDVRSGRSSRVLAGGVDAFSRTALMGFARLGALADDGCRPFGLARQGLVLGEGAAFLLVEELESALARGVEPLAELAGAGLSCDAHHPTSPHPEGAGAARAVRAALSDAGVRADDVGWVSAHGTGTPANDRAEVLALRSVFTGSPAAGVVGEVAVRPRPRRCERDRGGARHRGAALRLPAPDLARGRAGPGVRLGRAP